MTLSSSKNIFLVITLISGLAALVYIALRANGDAENTDFSLQTTQPKDLPTDQTRAQLPAPGGDTTLQRQSGTSFVQPAPNLSSKEKLDFWTGFGFFRDPWVAAPASTTARDGLGPMFSARSCIACHSSGGRGYILPVSNHVSSVVFRVGVVDNANQWMPHPTWGGQIQTRSTQEGFQSVERHHLVMPEAKVSLRLADYAPSYTDAILQKLTYDIDEQASDTTNVSQSPYEIGISVRAAPSLLGLGLLEAINDEDLRSMEDPTDSDGDGISGRVHMVPDRTSGDYKIGRFGWKAGHPTVLQQTAAAIQEDIGITNHLFPTESCTERQLSCKKAVSGNDPKEGVEIVEGLLDSLAFMTSALALPPPSPASPKIVQGKALFNDVGCQDCHRASYVTGESDVEAFSNQEIWPYTDLLLHDMGPELADTLPEHNASGSEWRTPPLWGIGLMHRVNRSARLLHDGRAGTIEEAILWHGGEGQHSREKFQALNPEERRALLAFVRAL